MHGKDVMAVVDKEGRCIDGDENPNKLKFAEVEVFGKKVRTLFESGAVTDVMNASLCPSLHIVRREQSGHITIADGKEATVVGEVRRLRVTIGDILTKKWFLVMRTAPVDLTVGRPTMKVVRVSLEFREDVATISTDGFMTRIQV